MHYKMKVVLRINSLFYYQDEIIEIEQVDTFNIVKHMTSKKDNPPC